MNRVSKEDQVLLMNSLVPCNLCGSSSHRLLFKARDLNWRTTEDEFDVVRCLDCGLIYLNPQPQNIEQYYPKTYGPHKVIDVSNFAVRLSLHKVLPLFYGYPTNKTVSRTPTNRLKYFFSYLKINYKNTYFFYRIPYGSNKKILDVGCGNGKYLLHLKSLGWNASSQLYGLDIPTETLKKLRETEAINIIEGDFLTTDLPENFFDAVTLRHVLEHLPDPSLAIKKVFNILKPGGNLLIAVPNIRSIEALLFREKWHHIDAPRHLYHFSPETLKKLLHNSRFIVEKMLFNKNSSEFVRGLRNYGYNVPKFIEKYMIKNMLKIFMLFGLSGELMCKAVKKQ
jgi:2-polyprenyl-3-methyl-5-hydroxy-6-metoxy-1,4-benzoquinol methylase